MRKNNNFETNNRAMKKVLTFFGMTFVIVLALSACSSDDNGAANVLVAFNNSGCKPSSGADNNSRGNDDMFMNSGNVFIENVIEYESTEDGYLTIQDVNAVFGCDAELSATAVTTGSNEITITENAHSTSNCECPYDLTIKVGPLKPGNYTLHINRSGFSDMSPTEVASLSIRHSPGLKGKHELPIGINAPYKPVDTKDMPAWLSELIEKDIVVIGGVVCQGEWHGETYYYIYSAFMSTVAGRIYDANGNSLDSKTCQTVIQEGTGWKCIYRHFLS